MNVHTGTPDPGRDTPSLAIDLNRDPNGEREQVVSPPLWNTITQREFDGPLLAFYVSLVLFLMALAWALSN
jgi:hypothetical protein